MPEKRSYADRKEYNRALHLKRLAEEPGYREKCRAVWRDRNREKYATDPEYRQKALARARKYAQKHGPRKKPPTGAVKMRQCTECGRPFGAVGRATRCGACP